MICDFIPRRMLAGERKVSLPESVRSETSQEWQELSESTLDLSGDGMENV